MADFERGQTFFDRGACNIDGTKGKYYIGMSNASYDDDDIVCFVLNTEKRMDQHYLLCNKSKQKFIIAPRTFSFISDYTSIMLNKEVIYKLTEMYDGERRLLDKADDQLARQIKNCIDFDFITPKYHSLIKDSFKS